jgi:hypothetical protein
MGTGSLNVPAYSQLVKHGVQARGIVTKVTPKFHNTASYVYTVDGRSFDGRNQSWLPNVPVADLKPGDPVIVFYDPQNPSRSVLGNPRPMLENELAFVGLGAVTLPTVVICILANNQRKISPKF